MALGSGLGADAYRWLARALSALAASGNLGCPSAAALRPAPPLIGITVQGCGSMAKARRYLWGLGMGHVTEASSQPARGRSASATSGSLDAPSDSADVTVTRSRPRLGGPRSST